jgi:hypothetical protein
MKQSENIAVIDKLAEDLGTCACELNLLAKIKDGAVTQAAPMSYILNNL